MKEIRDAAQVQKWITSSQIQEYFDTPDLSFRVYQYERGELILSPNTWFTELLFIVDGSAQIYGIRRNDSLTPVSLIREKAVLGDIEYSRPGYFSFYVQAKTPVTCLALSAERYRKQLDQDVRFLHFLLASVSEKLALFSFFDVSVTGLEEKVLLYMKTICPDGILKGVGEATLPLHCSRRQLQRVLKKLCDDGKIRKMGRGCYELQ